MTYIVKNCRAKGGLDILKNMQMCRKRALTFSILEPLIFRRLSILSMPHAWPFILKVKNEPNEFMPYEITERR